MPFYSDSLCCIIYAATGKETAMNERIRRLVDYALTEDLNPSPVTMEYDPFDLKLAEPMMIARRIFEYLQAQPIKLLPESQLIGVMRFSASPVPTEIFSREGHAEFWETCRRYYGKPQENLCTFEWQHSNADFGKLIRIGLNGYIAEINEARKNYLGRKENLAFLAALEMVIRAISVRADQCRAFCIEEAHKCGNENRRKVLLRMAENCANVPMNPARNFEEAIQCLYFSFVFIPDSLGRPDQYLYPLYKQGMEDGSLTREHAKELLQELFIRVYGYTPHTPWADDKGAESHFVIGGYTIGHEDGYNELSDLILESMMEMPMVRPQLSLRWNRKTPREVLRKLLDCERKDPHKRLAFVNDEPRIAALMNIGGHPWETAYDYIMVGCNEPAFQGGISLGGCACNIIRSLLNTMKNRRIEILECSDFDSFYRIYEEELFKDLEQMLEYYNRFNILRSRDCNVLSSLFLRGCIERAANATQGGAKLASGGFDLMGGTNLVDSLSVIRQFVFEEKKITLETLLDVLDNDWKDNEELRQNILRNGRFFGNHDEFADSLARKVYGSIFKFAKNRTDLFGNPLMYGNLTGYNPHFAWFGALTGATPDGRMAGSALTFGSGQAYGKEIDGATSHLLSVAEMDPTGIMCGNTIMNLTVDESTVTDEESFEKLVLLIETYFKAGGLHIQLNHVSREELIAAQANPDAYKSLRVRVSGFSATFVTLNEDLQNNVIARTTDKMQ